MSFRKKSMKRSNVTIGHALAVSFGLHAALGVPFFLGGWKAPAEDSSILVIEFKGVVGESQLAEKSGGDGNPAEGDSGAPAPLSSSTPPPAPEETLQETASASSAEAQSRPQTVSSSAGAAAVPDADRRQDAQTIDRERAAELERIQDYTKALFKRVQDRLVYPPEARRAGLRGTTTVSFTTLPTGYIRKETLKVAVSSGQPKLDASALKTLLACTPFEPPPPREMTTTISIVFGVKPRN